MCSPRLSSELELEAAPRAAMEVLVGARAKAAGAMAAAVAGAPTEAEHMGTTLLIAHILSSLDNNMTILTPSTQALHNNSRPDSRCIR